MVGVERFELPTLWSQTRCATRLRYTPYRQHDQPTQAIGSDFCTAGYPFAERVGRYTVRLPAATGKITPGRSSQTKNYLPSFAEIVALVTLSPTARPSFLTIPLFSSIT